MLEADTRDTMMTMERSQGEPRSYGEIIYRLVNREITDEQATRMLEPYVVPSKRSAWTYVLRGLFPFLF